MKKGQSTLCDCACAVAAKARRTKIRTRKRMAETVDSEAFNSIWLIKLQRQAALE